MRQRRWLELVKDYDCEILYHPGKANRVADALSRKTSTTVMALHMLPIPLQEEINRVSIEIISGRLAAMTLPPTIFEGLKTSQELDPSLLKIREEILEGKDDGFSISEDGILHRNGRICIPDDEELRNQILSKARETPYSIHPGATKMYQDLKESF